MDTFAAGALASLSPNWNVMKDRPRKSGVNGDFIITKSMARSIFVVGALFVAVQIALLLWMSGENGLTPYRQSEFFTFFVMLQFWNMFNARSYATGRSFLQLKHGKGFMAIVGVIVLGQIIIVELLYNFFNVEPMFHTEDWRFNCDGFVDWITIVGATSLVLWVREAWSALRRRVR